MRHIVLIFLFMVGVGLFGCQAFQEATSNGATKRSSVYRKVSLDNVDAKLSGAPIRFISEEKTMVRSQDIQASDPLVTFDGSSDYLGSRESIVIDPFGLSEVVPIEKNRDSLLQRLLDDQKNYYSGDSLLGLGGAFAIGGIFANTQLDHQIQKHFQSSVAGATSDEWFEFLHANKELGEGLYTLPIMGAAWLTGEVFDSSPQMERFGDWGERSMRGFVVGAPPLIAMQLVTGASRPGETVEGSEWQPFQDNNGVSGHAFMSSLPFITAAKMTEDPVKKSLWYLGSAIGPLSRVNDNVHYPSQIGLGWAMAYVAATAVDHTERGDTQWRLIPFSTSGSSGLALEYEW
ncbi:MAG: phosphatase PAP2 family protein [Pirellula sp.]